MTHGRQPHAVLDLHSRQLKAIKIERLLGLDASSHPIRLLEVGAGSGGISHYFGTHASDRYEVDAVDVHDSRVVRKGYRFTLVRDTSLPFGNAEFDVVLSNHVIEHVGNAQAQAHHLSELKRVLKANGVAYLAVPNRWMLIEPHYRLAFLSWLPWRWRTPYLRWRNKGEFYDCEPLQMHQLEAMLRQADFGYRNLCIEALRATFEIERRDHLITQLFSYVPDALMSPLKPLIPTLIYRLTRGGHE